MDTQLLETGFLHADPHPGNLLRTPEGKICILDFGLMTQVWCKPQGCQHGRNPSTAAMSYSWYTDYYTQPGFIAFNGIKALYYWALDLSFRNLWQSL